MAAVAEIMDDDNKSTFEMLSGTQKSAILMMLLGEDEAAAVLQKLTPREVQHLGTAMYSVTGVDQTTVNAVLDEFLETINKIKIPTMEHISVDYNLNEFDINNFKPKLKLNIIKNDNEYALIKSVVTKSNSIMFLNNYYKTIPIN